MPRPGSLIPKAPIAKIMSNLGVRVSDEAAKALSEYLLKYSTKISERAIKIARHSGRKTVKAGDIDLAKE